MITATYHCAQQSYVLVAFKACRFLQYGVVIYPGWSDRGKVCDIQCRLLYMVERFVPLLRSSRLKEHTDNASICDIVYSAS